MADSSPSTASELTAELASLPTALPLPAGAEVARTPAPAPPLPLGDVAGSVAKPIAKLEELSLAAATGRGASPTEGDPDDDLPALPGGADLVREAPAWLASAVVHMLLMIILGLIAIGQPIVERFTLTLGPEQAGEDLLAGDLDMPMDFDAASLDDAGGFEPQPIAVAEAADLTSTLPVPTAALGAASAAATEPIQAALSGREAGMKEGLLKAYGGTAGTQLAVEEALRWLARNQQKTGLWHLDGPYADGTGPNNRDAATALALIAFQGNGHTPAGDSNDPYTRLTGKAWKALLARQDEQGNFFQEGSSHGRLYTQAMCTIALCELYGMTRDSIYREQAERAVNYCVKIQSSEGGWRYFPGEDSDLSVTGWFVIALQSARMAGLDVPPETFQRVSRFLDSVSHDGGAQYAYVRGQGKKLSMTAEGLLCRQYLGWTHDSAPLNRGVEVLTQNLPSWSPKQGLRDSYYWYYAAQACHHMEGEPWRKWNAVMRVVLPEHQVKEGRERGSWDPQGDEWGSRGGGRLLVTCLHTFMLEVYYRHLPIYQLKLLRSAG
ncbi:MAG: terpene cyclase/mutase family protein [Pirellulales bacterium]|nr:terpene cyclase/mutase family protein [Pirellulales bacterium]